MDSQPEPKDSQPKPKDSQPEPKDSQLEPVIYICGDCRKEIPVKPGDAVQCRECGYRILYKKRTSRIIQYEAR
ncbi:hypothetical protein KFK09_005074 [Dendrobium nobile]|uniref:Uncharacterized protein n=1 Tax=Dendrobium nobile TaxID=94219 RepID=A0A8T3BZT3_DENNO|nr:hypothetical protein KFK09_005074 [Dendrobium nobile]